MVHREIRAIERFIAHYRNSIYNTHDCDPPVSRHELGGERQLLH